MSGTVDVVPSLRLRRDVAWWSYRLPAGMRAAPGSLVVIPFRGHPVLGAVWRAGNETEAAKESVIELLSAAPVVLPPARRLIEYEAERGITSLSTALHRWLPPGLRELPLGRAARRALAEAVAPDPVKQTLFLLPNRQPKLERRLLAGGGAALWDLKETASDLALWVAVRRGEAGAVLGRERGLHAPFAALKDVVVYHPEDIAYGAEQQPAVSAVGSAFTLAAAWHAGLFLRSYVPAEALAVRWPQTAAAVPPPRATVELTDLTSEPLVNRRLVAAIRDAVRQGLPYFVLLNAHDRTSADGKPMPGIETVRKQLAAALGLPELPMSVTVDTRAGLRSLPEALGGSAVLSLDPLLAADRLADRIHGWADVGALLSRPAPLIIQTRQPGHRLPQALVQGSFGTYSAGELELAHAAGLPPFAESVAVGRPDDEGAIELAAELRALAPDWSVGDPVAAAFRGTALRTVYLTAPSGTRLPTAARKRLAGLGRPWRVYPEAWHVL